MPSKKPKVCKTDTALNLGAGIALTPYESFSLHQGALNERVRLSSQRGGARVRSETKWVAVLPDLGDFGLLPGTDSVLKRLKDAGTNKINMQLVPFLILYW